MTDKQAAKIALKLEADGEPQLFPTYAEDEVRQPVSIADLMAKRAPKAKGRATERGELLKYFNEHLTNKQGKRFGIPFLAMKLQGTSVQDLYFLKSVCDQETGRTFVDKETGQEVRKTFGMVFWTELKTK